MTYDKNRESTRRWREANPEVAAEVTARFQAGNRQRINQAARTSAGVLRTLVFNHYGWSCKCCGSNKQPTIDHVDGGGKEHRKELSGHNTSGAPVWRWLIRNGFPDGFQTLCKPCNTSKGTGPACRINHGSTP